MMRDEQSIENILEKLKSYQPDASFEMVKKAYALACKAHAYQFRLSGDPYILHPLGVATILAELQIDATTISAAFLHDVVEDTDISLEEIEQQFGKEVALLVDGVTKMSKFEYKSKEEQQLENYRKMFLAMARDIRVVLIKLADRLHNMRTLRYMPPEKQKRIAKETMEIFAPLAHRLGIFNMKWELEDLSFRYLEPEKYYDLVDQMKHKRQAREEIVNEALEILAQKLKETGIRAEIQGRPKHFYSIFNKMQKSQKDLSEIYDLYAIRVIVDTVKDCYGALGIVHSLWKPLPYRFKDYIAMPKSNMYQSLHTTVIGTKGQPVEIQIRTWAMHRTSEYGIAAHWRYKEGAKGTDKDFDTKLTWLRHLLEWQQDLHDPREFVDALKLDVFTDEVFVFTPKGDVVDLPVGSIPIDFAYRIHTDVGHRCTGARVNGKIVPLEYKLTSGDIVDIITSKIGGPSRDWLNIVASSETKNKIRQWFKKENKEENMAKGREMLEKESKRLGYEWKNIYKQERMDEIARKIQAGDGNDLLASVGYGGVSVNAVLSKLVAEYKKTVKDVAVDTEKVFVELKPKTNRRKNSHGILVKGESGLLVRLARCCNPVPGDTIVGYVTRGRGVSIHRADCSNLSTQPDDCERMIEVEWDITPTDIYQVAIEINANDRSGLLSDIMMALSEMKINASSLNARVSKNKVATISMILDIKNLAQLEYSLTKLCRIRDVYEVRRTIQKNMGGSPV